MRAYATSIQWNELFLSYHFYSLLRTSGQGRQSNALLSCIFWDGVGPATELNTPFTMNSISNAYDNIEIVHGCRFVPRLK